MPKVEQSAKDAAALAVAALNRAMAANEVFEFLDNLDTAAREIGCAIAFRTTNPLQAETQGYDVLRYLEALKY